VIHTVEGTLAEIMARRADLNEMCRKGDDLRFVVTDKNPHFITYSDEYTWSLHASEDNEPRESELTYGVFGHLWWAADAEARRVDHSLDFDDRTAAEAALNNALLRWVRFGDCRLTREHRVTVVVTDKNGDSRQHAGDGPVAVSDLVLEMLCRPETETVTVQAVFV